MKHLATTRLRVSHIMLKLAILIYLELVPIGIVSLLTGKTYEFLNTVTDFNYHSDLKMCFIDDDSSVF